MRRLLASAAFVALACNPFSRSPDVSPTPVSSVRVPLRNAAGATVGEVTLRQTPNGVLVTGEFSGLPPGTHAFHIHETGRCEPTFDAAGGHWAPGGREHGYLDAAGPHAGDLPNLYVPGSGQLRFDHFIPELELRQGTDHIFDADGAALMVHAFGDDYTTDPSGGSGDRIACGVIGA